MLYSLVWNLKALFREIYVFQLINAQLLREWNLVEKWQDGRNGRGNKGEREEGTFKISLFDLVQLNSLRPKMRARKKDRATRKPSIFSPPSLSLSLIVTDIRSIHSAGTVRGSARICQVNWKGAFSSPGAWSNGILRLSNEANVF